MNRYLVLGLAVVVVFGGAIVWGANDTFDTADDLGTLGEHGTLRAEDYSISPPSDVDFVKFYVSCRMEVTIETMGVGDADTVIELYDSSYDLIGEDDDSGSGYYSLIQMTLDPGLYYVKVFEYGQDDEISNYDIVISGGACLGSEPVTTGTGAVVAWIPYSDRDEEWAHMREVLNRAGIRFAEITATDRDSLERALAGAGCLIIPEQEEAEEDELEDLGYACRWVLRDFLDMGGLIVGLSYARGADDILRGARIVDFDDAENITNETVYVADPADPLVRGVDSSFTGRDGATDFVGVDSRAHVVVEDADGDPVVFWEEVEEGRLIMIGFDFYEYNDAMATILVNAVAGTVPCPTCTSCPVTIQALGSVPGRISITATMEPGDLDFWSFTVSSSTYVSIETITDGDTVIYLYDENWNFLAADDDSGSGTGSLIEEYLDRGTYYVLVLDFGTPESYDYRYRLEIEG